MSTFITFLLVFIGMSLNEWRLYKAKSIDYNCMVNSIALLLMGLIAFIAVQYILSL